MLYPVGNEKKKHYIVTAVDQLQKRNLPDKLRYATLDKLWYAAYAAFLSLDKFLVT